MATITRVPRVSGITYKAVIRLNGIRPFSKTFKLRKDAKAWADRMERNIDEASAHGNDRARSMTLRELVREFDRQYIGKKQWSYSCLKWWLSEIGDMKLADITGHTIRDGVRKLETREVHRRVGGRKINCEFKARTPATLNRYKAALSAVFEFGKEKFELHENPCRKVKALPENNARIRFLSEDERKALLGACQKSAWDRLYLLVLMAITEV